MRGTNRKKGVVFGILKRDEPEGKSAWLIIDTLFAFKHEVTFEHNFCLTAYEIDSLPSNMAMPPDIVIGLN